jgi:hypothetical protein
MHSLIPRHFLLATSLALFSPPVVTSAAPATGDPGWPREFKQGGQKVVVHQPQIDSWIGSTNLHYRAAIAVTTGSGKKAIFGIIEGDARTVVDNNTRTVVLIRSDYELRFPNVQDSDRANLERTARALVPPSNVLTISLAGSWHTWTQAPSCNSGLSQSAWSRHESSTAAVRPFW